MPSVLFEYRGPGFGAQEHLVQALLGHARKGLGGSGAHWSRASGGRGSEGEMSVGGDQICGDAPGGVGFWRDCRSSLEVGA